MRETIRRTAVLGLVTLLATPAAAGAQEPGILDSAERLAAAVAARPNAGGTDRWTGRNTLRLVLMGAGLGLVLAGNPTYVPSRFASGNGSRRVDLRTYLGEGSHPGHTYQLVYRRGSAFGTGYACPPGEGICAIRTEELRDQYDNGFTDGYDVGRHDGLAVGHAEGFAAGQAELIRILDADGLVVYEGTFRPASYVEESFADRKLMRWGGAGLLAAGTLLGLFWPEAGNLDLTPLPGGGRVAASLGF